MQKNSEYMEIKEIMERLRGVVNKTASGLTSEDKQYIAERAQEYGITIRSKRCGSCYIDAAVQLYGILSKDAEAVQNDSDRKYVLRAGVNILFNGMLVNEAMLTDEKAEALIRAGLSTTFFAKYPTE